MKKQCVLIGGDIRHQYLAKHLIDQGFTVYCYGMERCIHLPKQTIVTEQIPQEATIVILPIPITKDGEHIFSIYHHSPISIHSLWQQFSAHQLICGGLFSKEQMQALEQQNISFFDYGTDEGFALNNAIPSAEGAIELAMQNTPHTLYGASVCVVGYGRIGKVLAKRLQDFGCNLTVTARKELDLQAIQKIGARAVETHLLYQEPPFDIIFNTVPAMGIDECVLSKQKETTLLIDLASKPGGIDFAYADKRHMRHIHALSLPAICAPLTAAQSTWNSICNYMEKEGRK